MAAPTMALKAALNKAPATTKSVPQQLAENAIKGRKSRADLTYSMHARLYPHLYSADMKPLFPQPKEKRRGQAYPSSPKYWESPVYKQGKVAWRQIYEDKKSEMARKHIMKLQVYPAKAPITKTCPDPVALVSNSQITKHDPSGARTRLFSRTNPECARVGDILLVRQRTGEPFAGVCINIRRRGVDTAILLRGQLTRVGVEMWFKVYSPLVEGIEVVQRAAKRARRARLTYMRKPKHDRGSVENVVRIYMRQKAALGTAEGKKKGLAGAGGAGGSGGLGGKKGNKRGKGGRR